jgi:hypothetical protein
VGAQRLLVLMMRGGRGWMGGGKGRDSNNKKGGDSVGRGWVYGLRQSRGTGVWGLGFWDWEGVIPLGMADRFGVGDTTGQQAIFTIWAGICIMGSPFSC